LSSAPDKTKAPFILTLLGSLVTLTLAVIIVALVLSSTLIASSMHPTTTWRWPMLPLLATSVLLYIMLTPGILGLVASYLIKSHHLLVGGILSIVAAVASLPVFLGAFLIGFLMLFIGGVLALTRA